MANAKLKRWRKSFLLHNHGRLWLRPLYTLIRVKGDIGWRFTDDRDEQPNLPEAARSGCDSGYCCRQAEGLLVNDTLNERVARYVADCARRPMPRADNERIFIGRVPSLATDANNVADFAGIHGGSIVLLAN